MPWYRASLGPLSAEMCPESSIPHVLQGSVHALLGVTSHGAGCRRFLLHADVR
jgi:hypothetical protein